MKIYFLYYSYEVGISGEIGGFRKLWELAYRLQKQGYQVRIFFPRLPKHRPLKPIPYTSYPLLNLSLLRPISVYLSMCLHVLVQGLRERPDIIYFRPSTIPFPVILAKCLGAKTVLEINADFRDFYNTVKISAFRYFLFSVIERLNVIFSNKIIVLTPGLKEILVKQYRIPSVKIDVVPSGTDTEHFFPQDSKESKRKIGLNPGRLVIGFAGIFYPHQGVDNLIYAAKHILKSCPEVLFLIVGEGIMGGYWKGLVKSEGLDNSFIFTGQVSYEMMPVYFNAIDVFVAPFASNRGETSPLKVFDALACGKIVVASSIPSIHLLAKEFNGSIVTVPPDDSVALAQTIIELVSDETKRNKLAKNGQQIILQKYSWDMIANRIANNIKNVK